MIKGIFFMFNAIAIALRNQEIFLKELTIGQIVQIAKIPQAMNELRLNAFIGYVCQDETLANQLTVQERYYILLNYLSISQNDYMMNEDVSNYFIQAKTAPDVVTIGNIHVQQLFGNHVTELQTRCENIYDWLAGQMACQLHGDMTEFFGDETNPVVWEKMPVAGEIITVFQKRFEMIESLTDSQFQALSDVFYQGCDKLKHLLDISLDNEGITILGNSEQQGGGDLIIARFRTLSVLSDIAKRISELINE